VRNLLAVPLGLKMKLRGIEDDLEMDVEGDEEEEIDGEGRDDCQDVKGIEEVNGCNKYLGRGIVQLLQSTSGQSEDRPVYSRGLIYISTVCTYVAWSTSQQVRNR